MMMEQQIRQSENVLSEGPNRLQVNDEAEKRKLEESRKRLQAARQEYAGVNTKLGNFRETLENYVQYERQRADELLSLYDQQLRQLKSFLRDYSTAAVEAEKRYQEIIKEKDALNHSLRNQLHHAQEEAATEKQKLGNMLSGQEQHINRMKKKMQEVEVTFAEQIRERDERNSSLTGRLQSVSDELQEAFSKIENQETIFDRFSQEKAAELNQLTETIRLNEVALAEKNNQLAELHRNLVEEQQDKEKSLKDMKHSFDSMLAESRALLEEKEKLLSEKDKVAENLRKEMNRNVATFNEERIKLHSQIERLQDHVGAKEQEIEAQRNEYRKLQSLVEEKHDQINHLQLQLLDANEKASNLEDFIRSQEEVFNRIEQTLIKRPDVAHIEKFASLKIRRSTYDSDSTPLGEDTPESRKRRISEVDGAE